MQEQWGEMATLLLLLVVLLPHHLRLPVLFLLEVAAVKEYQVVALLFLAQ